MPAAITFLVLDFLRHNLLERSCPEIGIQHRIRHFIQDYLHEHNEVDVNKLDHVPKVAILEGELFMTEQKPKQRHDHHLYYKSALKLRNELGVVLEHLRGKVAKHVGLDP